MRFRWPADDGQPVQSVHASGFAISSFFAPWASAERLLQFLCPAIGYLEGVLLPRGLAPASSFEVKRGGAARNLRLGRTHSPWLGAMPATARRPVRRADDGGQRNQPKALRSRFADICGRYALPPSGFGKVTAVAQLHLAQMVSICGEAREAV